MKNTRTLTYVAAGYAVVLAGFAIAPRLGWMHIDGLYSFSLGGLVVGLAVTLAAVGDRIRVNRRLARLTAPLAEQVRQDFEALARSRHAILS